MRLQATLDTWCTWRLVSIHRRVNNLLQKGDSLSGCQDSHQFSFPHLHTVLAHSTPVSAPSFLRRFLIYGAFRPHSIDSWSLGNTISIIISLFCSIATHPQSRRPCLSYGVAAQELLGAGKRCLLTTRDCEESAIAPTTTAGHTQVAAGYRKFLFR